MIDAYTCHHCERSTVVRTDHAADCPIRHPHPAQLMPQPKGYRCPACRHDTHAHREAGCDVALSSEEICECTAPFGQIMPGDPEPSQRS